MKERPFYRNVPDATNFFSDLGIESGMERPHYVIVGFENNNVNEQTLDSSNFGILNITKCYCKVCSEFYPEDRMNFIYGFNNYKESFKEIIIFNKDFNGLPHKIKPYISHRPFKCSYGIYDFTRYQIDHIGRQPVNLCLLYNISNLVLLLQLLLVMHWYKLERFLKMNMMATRWLT